MRVMKQLDHTSRFNKALAGTAFAEIRYVEETGSTNADAAALLGDRNSAASRSSRSISGAEPAGKGVRGRAPRA